MPRPRRLPALLLSLPLALAACGAGEDPTLTPPAAAAGVRAVPAPEAAALIGRSGTVVLDVRTPAEFAGGHVAGARNLDVSSADFLQRLSTLDREGRYVVYCRSGNRSAAAAAQMRSQGFTDVADAGAYADLVAAGVPSAP